MCLALAVLFAAARPLGAHAAPLGSGDPSYGNDQPDAYAVIYGPNQSAYNPGNLVALANGESLVADGSVLGVTKLTEAGAPALNFGNFGTGGAKSGTAVVGNPSEASGQSSASAVAVAPSGDDYVVAGESWPEPVGAAARTAAAKATASERTVGANSTLAVAEFTSAGKLDTSFASATATPGVLEYQPQTGETTPTSTSAAGVAVQPDGTILVVGTEHIGTPSEPALLVDRIASEGGGQESFSLQVEGQPTEGDAVAAGPNGTIYVAATENPGTTRASVVVAQLVETPLPLGPLFAAGTGTRGPEPSFVKSTLRLGFDPHFDAGGATPGELTSTLGGSSADVDALAVAPNGNLLIGGQIGTGTGSVGVVARITPAGTLDETFGSAGVATVHGREGFQLSLVSAIAVQPSGASVIAGDDFATSNGCEVCEARPLDPAVGGGPDALASEGRTAYRGFVAQLTAGGALDTNFASTSEVPGVAFTSARLGTHNPGRFLASGYETLAVTGLGIDAQGRVLLAAEEEDPSQPTVPVDGSVERFFGYAQPSAEFTFPARVYPDQEVTLDGSGSNEPTGGISDYLWTFEPPDLAGSNQLVRGSAAASRDGGSTPRLQTAFGSPGNVNVTLQVTNPAGQTSTMSHSVPVLPAPASGLPAASVSPESLSFHEALEEYDWIGYSYTQAPPQKVYVTNVGGAPLSISAVKIVKSAGGFTKEPNGLYQVAGEGSGAKKDLTGQLNETCTGATLAPGANCYVTVLYGNAGLYPKATGELEIASNSPTSPDFVSLTGTAQSLPPTPGRLACPTEIGSNGFSISPPQQSTLGEPLGPGLQACWEDQTAGSPNPVGDTFGTPGPVLIDKGVALWPTTAGDLLTVSPSGPHDATDTISAIPGAARYLVETTTASGGLPDQPLGIVEPGKHPFVCQATPPASTHSSINAKTPFQAQSPYGGCGEALLDFTSDTPPDKVHGLPVTGGSVKLTVCGADTTAYAELPGGEPARGKVGFRVTGGRGALPATATLHYGPFQDFLKGGCGQSTYPGEGEELGSGEGAAPELSCPGTTKVTPNCTGKEYVPSHVPPGSGPGESHELPGHQNGAGEPNHRGFREARPASVPRAHDSDAHSPSTHERDASAPQAHESDASASESGVCPAGDEDYSESIPRSFVGAMEFSEAYLCYDPGSGVWTTGGKADLAELTGGVLNGSIKTGPAPNYGFSFRSNGEFVRGGIEEVGFNPGIPIGGVVELDAFGGRFATDPTFVQAHATIGVAHLLSIKGSAFAVWANPAYPYTYQPEDIVGVEELQTNTHEHPFEDFAAGAGGEVLLTPPGIGPITLGQAYGLYAAPSYFEFAGCLGTCRDGLSLLGVATVKAYVKGALDTGDGEYDIEGGLEACADFPWPFEHLCGHGRGVVSNKGFGGCVGIGTETVSAEGGVTWVSGHGPRVFLGCGLEEVEVAVQRSGARSSANHDGAHAAQAGGPVSLKLSGHHPITDIWVKGSGGSPLLALSGPHGAQLSQTSAGTAVHAVLGGGASVLTITPEPSVDETLVAITHPLPGTWTLTPLAGSPQISKVEHASAAPPAKVSASVSGAGRTRTLAYRIRPRAGQRVTFVERGPEVFHVLGKTSAKHGKIRFTAASGPGARRKIEALITLSGVPQPAIVLGSYTAPPPPQTGRPPHLRLERHGDQLKISWGRAKNASRYLAVVSLSDGRTASYEEPARTHVATVPMVGPAVSGQVKVSGVGITGAAGAPASATLAPVHAPQRLTGLRLTHTRSDVVLTWKHSRGAKVYALRLLAPGGPAYTTVYLTKPRFVVSRKLPQVAAGKQVTISVTPVGTGGTGPAGQISYRAG